MRKNCTVIVPRVLFLAEIVAKSKAAAKNGGEV